MTATELMGIVMESEVKDSGRNMISILDWHGKGSWVKETELEYLVKLVHSEQKCRCLVNFLSSTLPGNEEYATVGGVAMDVIDYYRGEIEQFPGKTMIMYHNGNYPVWYRCPKTDAARAKEIEEWWANRK